MTTSLTKPQTTLLLFLLETDKTLDPIRLMEGMFIFSMEAPETWLSQSERYQFIPDSYGAHSLSLQEDLDLLVNKGYIRTSKTPGKNWDYYDLSQEGKRTARNLTDAMPEAARYLTKIRDYVLKVSLTKLMTMLYDKYPQYAVNSVFPRLGLLQTPKTTSSTQPQ